MAGGGDDLQAEVGRLVLELTLDARPCRRDAPAAPAYALSAQQTCAGWTTVRLQRPEQWRRTTLYAWPPGARPDPRAPLPWRAVCTAALGLCAPMLLPCTTWWRACLSLRFVPAACRDSSFPLELVDIVMWTNKMRSALILAVGVAIYYVTNFRGAPAAAIRRRPRRARAAGVGACDGAPG